MRDRLLDRLVVLVVMGQPIVTRPGQTEQGTRPGDVDTGLLMEGGDSVDQDSFLRSSHCAYSLALIRAGGISVCLPSSAR